MKDIEEGNKVKAITSKVSVLNDDYFTRVGSSNYIWNLKSYKKRRTNSLVILLEMSIASTNYKIIIGSHLQKILKFEMKVIVISRSNVHVGNEHKYSIMIISHV